MEVKGWALSNESPPEQLTDDGASVSIPYLTWYPKIDCYKLNISSLHFGKKSRGRFNPNLSVFDPQRQSMDEFLAENTVTRRKITSVVARIPDILGRLAPLTLRFKHDLRKLIEENSAWDDPVSEKQMLRWKTNFLIIEDVKDIMYFRCHVPDDAVDLKCRIYVLCYAAKEGIVNGAYSGFLKSDSTWSCNNILGRGLLAPEEWTITRKELGALNVASNVKAVVERALGD